MAQRTMTLDAWAKAVVYGDDAKTFMGDSPGAVGAKLGITRQAVHQAILRGYLDAIRLTDSRGELQAMLITEASVRSYMKRRRDRERLKSA